MKLVVKSVQRELLVCSSCGREYDFKARGYETANSYLKSKGERGELKCYKCGVDCCSACSYAYDINMVRWNPSSGPDSTGRSGITYEIPFSVPFKNDLNYCTKCHKDIEQELHKLGFKHKGR